jgi:hypothetical protein
MDKIEKMEDVLLAQSTLEERRSHCKKVVDSLPFNIPNPARARFIVKIPGPGNAILMPLTKKRFLFLKKKYGAENCFDKGPGFKDSSNIYKKKAK